MWVLKLLGFLAAVYLLILFAGYFLQDRMIFPTGIAEMGAVPLPPSARQLTIDTPDGALLVGSHIPATEAKDEPATVILGFGGNGWNADALAVMLHQLYPTADIVAFHYRGYAPSTGSPSADALIADANAIFDTVRDRAPGAKVIVAGLSLGAGVAAHLAAERPVDGLILVTPFDSMKALAHEHFPWAPTSLVLRHHMRAAEAMTGTDIPTAIVAAARDEIVPPRRTDALRQSVRNLVYDRTIPEAGHNDLYARPAFAGAMSEALSRVSARLE